jgi:hypothetical protein
MQSVTNGQQENPERSLCLARALAVAYSDIEDLRGMSAPVPSPLRHTLAAELTAKLAVAAKDTGSWSIWALAQWIIPHPGREAAGEWLCERLAINRSRPVTPTMSFGSMM